MLMCLQLHQIIAHNNLVTYCKWVFKCRYVCRQQIVIFLVEWVTRTPKFILHHPTQLLPLPWRVLSLTPVSFCHRNELFVPKLHMARKRCYLFPPLVEISKVVGLLYHSTQPMGVFLQYEAKCIELNALFQTLEHFPYVGMLCPNCLVHESTSLHGRCDRQ
jgi:hypothetical protein